MRYREREAGVPEVDDDADTASLRALDGLLDAEHQVRPAGAHVRAEDVRAVALVVNAHGDLGFRVGDQVRVAELRRRDE